MRVYPDVAHLLTCVFTEFATDEAAVITSMLKRTHAVMLFVESRLFTNTVDEALGRDASRFRFPRIFLLPLDGCNNCPI